MANQKYTQEKLNQLLKDLGNNEESVDDSAAFDIADGILMDEEGLEEFLKEEKGIKDPQGWLANYI